MKKNNKKRLKTINYQNEDTKEIKTLIIITLIIIVLVAGLYFFTEKALNKKKANNEEAVISYNEATIGMIFNRPYNEYYVFAYSKEDDNVAQYNTLLSNYRSKDDAMKIYYIDLASKFNSSAISDVSNPNPKDATEIKINKVALILIKDGKVSKYLEKTEDIEKALN